MEIKRILVIGGTGYIGKCLVKELIKNNYKITLLIRKKRSLSEKYIGCNYFICDLTDKKCLTKHIKKFDLVINLASVVRTINKKRYKENIVGIRNLLEVLEKKIIKKIIYFSTQNVNLKNKGYYVQSKELSEKLIKNSELDYMIIRPNYVYGIDRQNDFFRMAKMISYFRIAVIIGHGNNIIQPLLKEDLAKIVTSLINKFKRGSIIEISGDKNISINKVIELIGKKLNKKFLMFHIPVKLLYPFRNMIPFDTQGFDEDKLSKKPFRGYKFEPFEDNLEKILGIL